jgi:hypothetical protein
MQNLPKDILSSIFGLIGQNPHDLCKCMQVCSQWRYLARDNKIWEEMFNRTFDSSVGIDAMKFWFVSRLDLKIWQVFHLVQKKQTVFDSEPEKWWDPTSKQGIFEFLCRWVDAGYWEKTALEKYLMQVSRVNLIVSIVEP